MRLSVAMAMLAVAVPLGFSMPSASAQYSRPFEGQTWWGGHPNVRPGAWCMNSRANWDAVDEDCSFPTLAACQRALVNPNAGFCTRTGFAAPPSGYAPPRKVKRRAR